MIGEKFVNKGENVVSVRLPNLAGDYRSSKTVLLKAKYIKKDRLDPSMYFMMIDPKWNLKTQRSYPYIIKENGEFEYRKEVGKISAWDLRRELDLANKLIKEYERKE